MYHVAARSAVLRAGLDSLNEETGQASCHVLTRDTNGWLLVRQVLYGRARCATCDHITGTLSRALIGGTRAYVPEINDVRGCFVGGDACRVRQKQRPRGSGDERRSQTRPAAGDYIGARSRVTAAVEGLPPH